MLGLSRQPEWSSYNHTSKIFTCAFPSGHPFPLERESSPTEPPTATLLIPLFPMKWLLTPALPYRKQCQRSWMFIKSCVLWDFLCLKALRLDSSRQIIVVLPAGNWEQIKNSLGCKNDCCIFPFPVKIDKMSQKYLKGHESSSWEGAAFGIVTGGFSPCESSRGLG